MRLLLESKVGVDKAPSLGGCTPLYIASQLGYLEGVKCLVEEGKAEVDKADEGGVTPLFVASGMGHLKVVKYFEGKGCKCLRRGREKNTKSRALFD